jgi:2-phospho-L-lactate/phosphoenolpyruvate guanylyltransferase
VKRAIVVPVKEENPKLRLAPQFSAGDRGRLASAMFEDVARALVRLRPSETVVVVTSSERALVRARELGWRGIRETEQVSESASIDRACALLAAEGIEAALRVPADVPLIEPDDIAALLEAIPPAPGAVLAPSRDRSGTNALARTPPTLFPARFGSNSFVLHRQEAQRTMAEVRVVELPRLALDLDDASDVLELLERDSGSASETARVLRSLGLADRPTHRA